MRKEFAGGLCRACYRIGSKTTFRKCWNCLTPYDVGTGKTIRFLCKKCLGSTSHPIRHKQHLPFFGIKRAGG